MSRNPLVELKNTNQAIERYFSEADILSRGAIAQDAVNQFRNLVEHLSMALKFGDSYQGCNYYQDIKPTLEELKRVKSTHFLWEFHRLLQKVVSHYTPTEDGSQRLLLKYKDYLFLCRDLAIQQLNINILAGLKKLNWNDDPGLKQYYELILEQVESFAVNISAPIVKERYYVYSRKPVFSRGRIFYEYSLAPAMDFTSKFDHVIAFSMERIPTNYSISISVKRSSISALGSSLPVMIVDGWRTSIRPCEINKILKIVGSDTVINGQLNSYKRLMEILTVTGMNLIDLCLLCDEEFKLLISDLDSSENNQGIVELFEKSRSVIYSNKPGTQVLKYLLYRPRNKVIENQLADEPNSKLSNLNLNYGCIPFDTQPYCTSLMGHSPSFNDLVNCIDPDSYENNLLVRAVRKREENDGIVFVSEKDLASFENPDALSNKFNRALYYKHEDRALMHEMVHFFIKSAETDLVKIINNLTKLSKEGIEGYRASTVAKLEALIPPVDDPRKVDIASGMFEKSKVALLYGSAGTGKTTLINIVCDALSTSTKLALANTNPAVDNLKRRVKATNCEFMTIAKYLRSSQSHDIDLLVIDECSTVSNADMSNILSRGRFKLLLLVGDTYQIEAIRLGSWFDIVRSFLDKHCLFELEQPWRTASDNLKALWNSVRLIKDDISERLVVSDVSRNLDETLFKPVCDDEIILCLNYDGLYGINNINRMLQASNHSRPVLWGLHVYKIGDPILFNESNRFAPVLYNNLKGKISGLALLNNRSLQVEVDVNTPLSAIDVMKVEGLSYVKSFNNGSTRLCFEISEHDEDGNGDSSKTSIVPFQIAYAVSIHKAQGLEYDSVKVIVTKDVEEKISHSIFYTAITRAKSNLAIYWSPETQNAVINGFARADYKKDSNLIANRNNLKLFKERA